MQKGGTDVETVRRKGNTVNTDKGLKAWGQTCRIFRLYSRFYLHSDFGGDHPLTCYNKICVQSLQLVGLVYETSVLNKHNVFKIPSTQNPVSGIDCEQYVFPLKYSRARIQRTRTHSRKSSITRIRDRRTHSRRFLWALSCSTRSTVPSGKRGCS